MCEIGSKLTIMAWEQRRWSRFVFLIVNFEQISHIGLALLFLTLNK